MCCGYERRVTDLIKKKVEIVNILLCIYKLLTNQCTNPISLSEFHFRGHFQMKMKMRKIQKKTKIFLPQFAVQFS